MWAEPRPPQYPLEAGWIEPVATVAALPEPSAWTEARNGIGCVFRAAPVAAGTRREPLLLYR